jgi:hypothetical protein
MRTAIVLTLVLALVSPAVAQPAAAPSLDEVVRGVEAAFGLMTDL